MSRKEVYSMEVPLLVYVNWVDYVCTYLLWVTPIKLFTSITLYFITRYEARSTKYAPFFIKKPCDEN